MGVEHLHATSSSFERKNKINIFDQLENPLILKQQQEIDSLNKPACVN